MKLEIGVPDYEHEGGLKRAVIRGRKAGRDLPLRVISLAGMKLQQRQLPNLRGFPVMVAVDPEARRVWLHPVPDGEYWLDITPEETPPPVTPLPTAAPKPGIVGTITKAMIRGR